MPTAAASDVQAGKGDEALAVFGECHAGTELYALAEANANLALHNPADAFVSPAVVFATAQGNCREYAMVLQVLLSQVAPALRAKIAVSIRAGHSFVEVYLPAFDRYYYIEPQYDGSDWAVCCNEHGAGAPRKGGCSTDNRCFLDRFDIAVSVAERDGLCALESIGPRDWWQGLGEADRWRCMRQSGRGPLRWCNIEGAFCPAYDGLR